VVGAASGPSPAAPLVHDLDVSGCTFEDCTAAAVRSSATRSSVLNSTFSNCDVGVQVEVELHALVEGCVFIGCSTAILADSPSGPSGTPSGLAEVRRCRVLSSDGAMSFRVAQTVVEECELAASGAISFENDGPDLAIIRGNVFRESHIWSLEGSLLYGDDLIGEISNNTFVGCSCLTPYGPGALIESTPRTGELNVHHNIVAGTLAGVAIEVFASSPGSLSESCNCYWENMGGNTSGFEMAPTSIVANPRFCDPKLFEQTIRSDSPCAPPGPTGCGLIGAKPVGCGAVALESESWGEIKARYR
jgi:hypothetical protein